MNSEASLAGQGLRLFHRHGGMKQQTRIAVIPMELTTKRCLIRNMTMEDADQLHQGLSDERVMKYLEPAFDMAKTKNFIQSAGLCEPPLIYAIVWKTTGGVIGHAIFHSYEENSCEIGWVLQEAYWGMGIADEVTTGLIEAARDAGAESCIIECDERQIASKRIAAKNGFVYEGKADGPERYRLML